MKRELKIALLLEDGLIKYYIANCSDNILKYIWCDLRIELREDRDILLYTDEALLSSQTQLHTCRHVEHYNIFLKAIGIVAPEAELSGFSSLINESHKAGNTDLFYKMWKHYGNQISMNTQNAINIANMQVAPVCKEVKEKDTKQYREEDLVRLCYLSKSGNFSSDDSNNSSNIYYTNGEFVVIEDTYTNSREVYALAEFDIRYEWCNGNATKGMRHLTSSAFLPDVFFTRAKQISTYKNSERDRRHRDEDYPVSSAFYNSLVEQTADKAHISPNQLEDMYILCDVIQQLDIELSTAKEAKAPTLSIYKGEQDYHKAMAAIMFESKTADCISKHEARKQLLQSVTSNYRDIFTKAEQVQELSITLINKVRPINVLAKDKELFEGIVRKTLLTKLPIATSNNGDYREEDLVLLGYVNKNNKAIPYHGRVSCEGTLYESDGRVVVITDGDNVSSYDLIKFTDIDSTNSIVYSPDYTEVSIPLTFLQIAKDVTTYKNGMRDTLYQRGSSQLNSTFYNSLVEMQYQNVVGDSAKEIEYAVRSLFAFGKLSNVTYPDRIKYDILSKDNMDEIDSCFSLGVPSYLMSTLELSDINTADAMLPVYLEIFRNNYSLINSAYFLQLIEADLAAMFDDIAITTEEEVDKYTKAIMSAINLVRETNSPNNTLE